MRIARRQHVRLALASLVAVLGVLGTGGTAHADPAGPTDYRSEVLDVQPPTALVEFEIIGGDSFLQATVASGTEVQITGYRGEPYLLFQSDGTVLENRLSPTTYLNEERFGNEFPDFADPEAAPEWTDTGSEGRFAWHDHRAHLMQPIPPPNTSPGDRIVESVVPIVVDGVDTKVTVISVWQPEPSAVPVWSAIAAGIAVAVVGIALWMRRKPWVWLAVPPAGLALALGVWQYTSLPPETGPRLVWWALPAVAAVAGIGAVVMARRAPFAAVAAALVAGVNLAMWGAVKRDGLTAAIVPTNAPNGLDRFGTMLALVGGVAIAILALLEFFGPRRELADTS